MGYVGGKLEPWFKPGSTILALRDLAEKGGEHMTELTRANTPVDTGELRASWTTKPLSVSYQGARAIYQSGVETDLDYAPHVEHGTGLWGPSHSKYLIEPKHPDGWLHWIDPLTGQDIFAKRVMHPGSPGNHMVAFAAAITEHELPQVAAPVLKRWALETERQNKTGIGRR